MISDAWLLGLSNLTQTALGTGCCVTRLAGAQPCQGGGAQRGFLWVAVWVYRLPNTSFLLIRSAEESWGRGHFLIKSTSVTVWYEMCWVSECTYYSQPLSEIKSNITLPLVQTHGSTKCVSAHRSLENLVHHWVECDWSWMTSTDVQSTSSKLGRTGLAQERQVLLDRKFAILPKKASLQCITIAIQLTSYRSSTLLVTYYSY